MRSRWIRSRYHRLPYALHLIRLFATQSLDPLRIHANRADEFRILLQRILPTVQASKPRGTQRISVTENSSCPLSQEVVASRPDRLPNYPAWSREDRTLAT